MYKLSIILVVCLFKGYQCDRDDIINQYTPILAEKSANLTTVHNTIVAETNIVTALVQNNTWNTVTLIQSQITALKTTITNAKATAANKTSVLNCIAVQETAAAQLSADPVNATCWVNVTHPDLTDARDAFVILAKIPSNTMPACTTLNPLTTQDDLFLSCINDKILDLDEQLKILQNDFDAAREDTINGSVECLAQQSAEIGESVDEISVQVSICLI